MILQNYAKQKKKPIADFEDGRRSLILAAAANKSLKTKMFEKIKF